MKTRILVACLVLAIVALGYQVFQYTQIAQQAQNPLGPGQRFATHPGAPTEEEIEREEKRLEQKVQQDRAAAAAAAAAKAKQTK
jgi:cytochrome c-type biogenesis protein CcmH/NrfG